MSWLGAGLFAGTAFFIVAALLSATVLKRAHPSARAALFTLVLLRFVVPFSPSLGFAHLPESMVSRAQMTIGDPVIEAVAPRSFDLLFVLWLAGVLFITTRRIVKGVRVTRRVATFMPAPRALMERLKMKVLLSPPGEGPFVVGLIRPTLVLPSDASGPALEAMIVHELMHLRRHDPLLRFFQSVVETLFFFWPPVRLTSRWLSLAREQACDLAVVESRVITPSHYAELLLHLGLTPEAGLSMAANPSHLERRITMLLDEKKLRPMWGVVVVAMFVALISGASVRAETPAPSKAEGRLDKELIRKAITEHSAEVRFCYEQQLVSNPKLEGKMVLTFIITADGTVRNPRQAAATTIDESVGKCIVKRAMTWVFPRPTGGSVNVSYPFIFSPGT